MEENSIPSFGIVGAQKAATTFLHSCLREHPNIFMPEGELADFEDPNYETFNRTEFLDHFKNGKDLINGFRRPNYLHRPEVPSRLVEHVPNLKIIVSLRDPIERAVSAYFHFIRMGFVPVRDPNHGIPKIASNEWEDRYPRSKEILDFGLYYRQIKRYVEKFDKKNILIVKLEDIKKDALKVVSSICKFIGVNPNLITEETVEGRSNTGVYSLSRLSLIRLKNPILYKYHYDRRRLENRSDIGVAGRVGLRIVNLIDRAVMRPLFSNSRPKLEEGTRKILIDYYYSDSSKLRKNTDLDIGGWGVFSDKEGSG